MLSANAQEDQQDQLQVWNMNTENMLSLHHWLQNMRLESAATHCTTNTAFMPRQNLMKCLIVMIQYQIMVQTLDVHYLLSILAQFITLTII